MLESPGVSPRVAILRPWWPVVNVCETLKRAAAQARTGTVGHDGEHGSGRAASARYRGRTILANAVRN